MDTRLNDDLSAKIEEIVRHELSNEVVDAVEVRADFDADDDPVLRVTVILKSKHFDVSKARGLVRHLRPALEKARMEDFPILSFLTMADHKKLVAAH